MFRESSYRGYAGGSRGSRRASTGRAGAQSNSGWHNQKKPSFSGEFVGIDPNVQFLKEEQVDGVSLLTDYDLVKELQVKLGRFAHGPEDFFPVNWPVSLSMDNIKNLEMLPYVVTPKPVGIRFLLYIDSEGSMFMENMTQHIFKLDEDHAPQLTVKDTVLDGLVVRKIRPDGLANCEANEEVEEAEGKLTFVIMDATRCSGVDLTGRNIQERISFIRDEVMNPRLDGIESRCIRTEREIFDLDITKYEEAFRVEEYLSREFKESYKYPLRSVVFHPRHGGYKCGTCPKIFQWEEKSDQECSFRLKLSTGNVSTGDLFVVGPGRIEMKYTTIDLTDDLKKMNGSIIECRYVDHHWIFVRLRNDRKHPNGRRTVIGKLEAMENPVKREYVFACLEKSRGIN